MLAHSRPRLSRLVSVALIALGAVLLALTFFPRRALAADLEVNRVQIEAHVQPDGSLIVNEARLFEFNEHYNGVYWYVPYGSAQGRDVTAVIDAAGIYDSSENFHAFQQVESANKGDDGVYTVSDDGNRLKVMIYHPSDNVKVWIGMQFHYDNAAWAWADTGELYWKFVADGWDMPSDNVTCDIYLPAPEGTTFIPEENVRAWGHGPLDASVEIESDHVHYDVPGVGTKEFAEARIAFPSSWLSQVQPSGGERLQTILSEEKKWADDANARRDQARIMRFVGLGLGIVLPVIAVVAAFVFKLRFRAAHRPLFQDEYFRDVPSDDHPAVLGMVYNGGDVQVDQLSASILRLADRGVIGMERIEVPSNVLKKPKTHYVVSLNNASMEKGASGGYKRSSLEYETSVELDDIDRATVAFLFRKVAPRTKHFSAEGGKLSMWMDEIEVVAKKHYEDYCEAWERWEDKVTDVGSRRRFFVDDTDNHVNRTPFVVIMVICCAIALVCGIVMAFFFDFILEGILAIFITIGAGMLCGWIVGTCDEMSKEAIELQAQTKALRKWLLDFTRLKEAVPHDVILWNRLLVMATSLGVADKVVKNLKVAYPDMFNDPDVWPMYWWYYDYGYGRAPYSMMSDTMQSAHHVSSSALASSSSSSGGGGGGGFSGGGGGGFGGGGGGGGF